jgi:thymidine phosphorylase
MITDMNQVLGHTVGNALEVMEAIAYLRGDGVREPRQHEVTLALGAELLVLGGLASDTTAARARLQAALDSGAATEHFARMVAALGGPADLMERPAAYLPAAPVLVPVPAPTTGVMVGMQTRDIGMAMVELGGGRRKATDTIDARVGLTQVQPLGTHLQKGEPMAWVHAADAQSAQSAVAQLQQAFTVVDDGSSTSTWQTTPTVIETIAHPGA